MVAKPGRQGNTGGKSELFNRLMFVIIGLVVFRFGSFIPVPGINTDVLEKMFESQTAASLGCSICFPAVLCLVRPF